MYLLPTHDRLHWRNSQVTVVNKVWTQHPLPLVILSQLHLTRNSFPTQNRSLQLVFYHKNYVMIQSLARNKALSRKTIVLLGTCGEEHIRRNQVNYFVKAFHAFTTINLHAFVQRCASSSSFSFPASNVWCALHVFVYCRLCNASVW